MVLHWTQQWSLLKGWLNGKTETTSVNVLPLLHENLSVCLPFHIYLLPMCDFVTFKLCQISILQYSKKVTLVNIPTDFIKNILLNISKLSGSWWYMKMLKFFNFGFKACVCAFLTYWKTCSWVLIPGLNNICTRSFCR